MTLKVIPWKKIEQIPLDWWYKNKTVEQSIYRILTISVGPTIIFIETITEWDWHGDKVRTMLVPIEVNMKELAEKYVCSEDLDTWVPCGRIKGGKH